MPKNALFGNGLIIQYGGSRYTNAQIITRALETIRSGEFPEHLYPAECADLVLVLRAEARSVLMGAYDRFAFAGFEKAALESFKSRYAGSRRLTVESIGFEDYFLLFELAYNKLGKTNPERFMSRGVLRRMLLDSIFDRGAIQEVHKRFPGGFLDWLSEFSLVFTTNYDGNLESAGAREVLHLHGAFDVLSDVYDPNSFRNQLSEDLLNGEKVDWNYPHLYSTCLMWFVSDLKSSSMEQAGQANLAMEKLAEAYKNDPKARADIDAWEDAPSMATMREAIQLKSASPDLQHAEQYPVARLREAEGELSIIGLSATNDNHVFDAVSASDGIDAVEYFYFTKSEASMVSKLLEGKNLQLTNVRDLWAQLEDA